MENGFRKRGIWANRIAAAFTVVCGTLLHFAYERFGGSFFAVIAPVNESTWEHLKLLFWPILLFAIVEYFVYGVNCDGFIAIKCLSIPIATGATVVAFYTYTGVLGFNFLAADIATFLIGVAAAYLFCDRLLRRPPKALTTRLASILTIAIVAAMTACFAAFTFFPPEIGLFVDPLTGGYGIVG